MYRFVLRIFEFGMGPTVVSSCTIGSDSFIRQHLCWSGVQANIYVGPDDERFEIEGTENPISIVFLRTSRHRRIVTDSVVLSSMVVANNISIARRTDRK
jgi:hypothetical protein